MMKIALINNMGEARDYHDYDYKTRLRRNISDVVVDHQLEFSHHHDDDDDGRQSFMSKVDDEDENDPQERRIFWESQAFLLQEILDKSNSSGSKMREEINRNIEIARESNNFCSCQDRCCIKCLRQAALTQLCSKGFNATLCTSKWKRTHKIPGGSHEYIEVIACTQGRRKQIPFLVDLGFKDEFRMAKACDEYNKLIDQLPDIYIGKVEHLNAVIRLVCEAAKKSAKEKKIHMGPWRKRNFMQMKWSASSERRFLDYTSDGLWVNPSTQGSSKVASGFKLPKASTVEVVA